MRLIDADALRADRYVTSLTRNYLLQYVSIEQIDNAPTIPSPRWVRCEERLPENKKHYYLVCTDMGYMCSCRWTNNVYGFRESDNWGWSMIDVPQYQKVTHWMPIEPPKNKED